MKRLVALLSLSIVLLAANQHALGATLFADDFEAELPASGQTNHSEFKQWVVTAGAVDLVTGLSGVGAGFVPARAGLFVDLDGTAQSDGTIRTRDRLDLEIGKYALVFDIGSTNRPGHADDQNGFSAKVFGQNDHLEQNQTVHDGMDFQTQRYVFEVATPDSVYISFASIGSSDNFGAVIDNVRLEAVPIPPAALLLLGPLGLLGWAYRKRASA